MKKATIYLLIFAAVNLSACNGTNKTGGATRDSSASHGNGGPADTSNSAASGTAVQSSTSGTDTSSNGKGTAAPVTTDTTKTKKP